MINNTVDDTKKAITQGIKYRWIKKNCSQSLINSIASKHNISIPIAEVLTTRGIIDEQQIQSFLFDAFEQVVQSPHLMKDVITASSRIITAIKNHEKILIFGDYDVDGVTSTSLMLVSLIPLGANINFFLPHRVKDGYGLSISGIERAHKNGYTLIVTVDNGIAAVPAAIRAKELGIDLIITDHHHPHDQLPPALAVIDPHQHDCHYPFKYFAGVGVIFKLICYIYETLGIKQLPEKVYELLMLGTIADVVPLTGENRFWVRHGLQRINTHKSTAINVLAQNSKLTKERFDSLDIGFSIAPQINALGRLSDPRDAVRFMVSSDHVDVERIGLILKQMNEERKLIDRTIYEEIEQQILSNSIDLTKDYVIIAASNKWPAGVIGLVAGKLMHNYGRPALLFHIDNNGIAKGSCRSIPECNIFDILQQNQDLLLQFGGHAFAAGLKLKQENISLLKERISKELASQFTISDLQPKVYLDATLSLAEMNHVLMNDMQRLEPFGNKNPQPLFLIKQATLLKNPTIMKEKHLKCLIFADGVIKPVVFFNRPDLITVFDSLGDKPFDLVAHVIKNEWQGTTKTELHGIDIATMQIQ